MATQKGTITILTDRQSGFIKRKGVAEDLFFHSDHVIEIQYKDLKIGDHVAFEVTETRNGPYAISVTRIK